MDKFLNAQLEKLKTDHIDYYLIHALVGELWDNIEKLGVADFLDKAKADGRIINAGFSFHARERISIGLWMHIPGLSARSSTTSWTKRTRQVPRVWNMQLQKALEQSLWSPSVEGTSQAPCLLL